MTDALAKPALNDRFASQGRRSIQRCNIETGAAYVLLTVAYLVVAHRLFRIISSYAVNIFFWDQWDFNDAMLFQQHSWWQAFRWQHGPHRQGLGAVLQKLLEPFISWNTRSEAFGIGAIILLASFVALYLKRRLFGDIELSDIVIPLLFLTPAQFSTLVITANPAHGPLPLLLLVLYCLAWSVPSYRWKYIAVSIINFVMIYTGFGVFIGFITPLLITADLLRNNRQLTPGPRRGCVVALFISLASLASFFVGYRMAPAVNCFSFRQNNNLQYARFISLMMADFIGVKGTGLYPTVAGTILVVAFLLVLAMAVKALVLSRDQGSRELVICALLGYCLLFCVNAAYGRLCLGLEAAQSSRYMIYLIPGVFALYLYALSRRGQGMRGGLITGVVLVALLSSWHLSGEEWRWMQNISRGKQAWKTCYLARHDIEQCNLSTQFKIYPWPPQDIHMQEKLEFLQRNHLNLYAK